MVGDETFLDQTEFVTIWRSSMLPTGDFFQLPPVGMKCTFMNPRKGCYKPFQGSMWRDLDQIVTMEALGPLASLRLRSGRAWDTSSYFTECSYTDDSSGDHIQLANFWIVIAGPSCLTWFTTCIFLVIRARNVETGPSELMICYRLSHAHKHKHIHKRIHKHINT